MIERAVTWRERTRPRVRARCVRVVCSSSSSSSSSSSNRGLQCDALCFRVGTRYTGDKRMQQLQLQLQQCACVHD